MGILDCSEDGAWGLFYGHIMAKVLTSSRPCFLDGTPGCLSLQAGTSTRLLSSIHTLNGTAAGAGKRIRVKDVLLRFACRTVDHGIPSSHVDCFLSGSSRNLRNSLHVKTVRTPQMIDNFMSRTTVPLCKQAGYLACANWRQGQVLGERLLAALFRH